MVQFATVAELADFIGRPIDPDQEARATLLLQLASAAVQRTARQQFDLHLDDVVTLSQQAGIRELRLPQRPVLAVASVKLNGIQVTGYDFTRQGRVRWLLGDQFAIMDLAINAPTLEPDLTPIITVTYSHGYALEAVPDPNPLGITLLPDDVKGVTLQAAARIYTSTDPAGAPMEGPGAVVLTPDEEAIVARYGRAAR